MPPPSGETEKPRTVRRRFGAREDAEREPPFRQKKETAVCQEGRALPEMARRRLDAQLPENVLRAAADFVIENDGTLQQMQQRCNALLTALRKEAYGETSDEK